jgi:hypothetical protein
MEFINLDISHLDDVIELQNKQDNYMGVPKKDIDYENYFNKEYWELWLTDPNHQMTGYFKDGVLKVMMGIYYWKLFPYTTLGNHFADPTLGFKGMMLNADIMAHCCEEALKRGHVKSYIFNGRAHVDQKRRKRYFGRFEKRTNGKWTHKTEEIIPAFHMTKWKGFKMIAGMRAWPMETIIRSLTLNDEVQ